MAAVAASAVRRRRWRAVVAAVLLVLVLVLMERKQRRRVAAVKRAAKGGRTKLVGSSRVRCLRLMPSFATTATCPGARWRANFDPAFGDYVKAAETVGTAAGGSGGGVVRLAGAASAR